MALSDLRPGVRNDEGIKAAVDILKQRFGDRLQTGQALREQHAHTTSYIPPQPPDAVVYPETSAEIREIVRVCAEHRTPIIPFGVGSSLEGHVNAPDGGISLDTSRMNRVIEVNPEDLDCTVEPGVTREDLNTYLRDTGLFFPIDPGANATIGGMAVDARLGHQCRALRHHARQCHCAHGRDGERRGGAHGAPCPQDLGRLRPDAALRRFGRHARRDDVDHPASSGHPPDDRRRRLRIPDPGGRLQHRHHDDPDGHTGGPDRTAGRTPDEGLQRLFGPAYAVAPTLFVEFHGTDETVAIQSRMFGEIAAEFEGGEFLWTADAQERAKLWKARHNAYFASMRLRPGCNGLSTDVCVPISRLAECIAGTQADIADLGLVAPIVGHAGDGNFHVLALMDMNDPEEIARVEEFTRRLNARALSMDGTCTGEHGIGQGKQAFLEQELGGALGLMRQVKRALDPLNIMNPGKIFSLQR